MNDTVLFNSDGETAARAVTAHLARQEYRVFRSFDLRSTLTTHGDCACPYHGTTHCTCQFVVLLVYSNIAGPVVITAHSYDAQTRLRIIGDALTQPDPYLAGRVMAILKETALVCPNSTTSFTEVSDAKARR